MAVAVRTRSTSSPRPELPDEYDNIATFGSMPNFCAVLADAIAISANSSAVGLGTTAQSP